MSKPSLREEMPTVTKIIDDFRAVFGTTYINSIIRAGLQGEPGFFWASENGHALGTPFPSAAVADPFDPAAETRRERYYRVARSRSVALTTGRDAVQTSAPTPGAKA